jgi:hypothetical protein
VFIVKNILRIQKFDFEDGKSLPRDKFILILFTTGEDAILAPLTTSVDTVPDHHKSSRCIKDDPSCIHCYFIPKQLVIGERGFFFPKDTFIHVHPSNLKNRKVSNLKSRYEDTGVVELKDILTLGEYSDLLYCIYKSRHVPRGVRKALEPLIEALENERAGLV